MAPDGPAPITATFLIGMSLRNLGKSDERERFALDCGEAGLNISSLLSAELKHSPRG